MTKSFGSKVSRTLDPKNKQFINVVVQAGNPPLDSETNLSTQLVFEKIQEGIKSIMPSGFLIDPSSSKHDYITNSSYSNRFGLGRPKDTASTEDEASSPILWANVNGWIIPVCGTNVENDDDIRNFVNLYPPPATDNRVDFVFLEAWACLVSPNPSTANKPSASTVWKYGNTQFGGTNISDDITDPTIQRETSKRVQVQYRFRVFGSGVGLSAGVSLNVFPEGFDNSLVLGQGAASEPQEGLTFTNLYADGDSGLWRSGDGDPDNGLGTVDGYTYAIPVCAIFRRNSSSYVSVTSSGNPNHNGAVDRNPNAGSLSDPLTGAKLLSEVVLDETITNTTTGNVDVVGLVGSNFDEVDLDNIFFTIDDEIVKLASVNTVSGSINIESRGHYGTSAVGHNEGTTVKFYSNRPDNKFADQVSADDILDLRHAVNPGDWDYDRLLQNAVSDLIKGDLKSTWKQASGGNTQGTLVHEVAWLHADGGTANPNHTEALDGPDGIRTIWSDAAVIQPGVTLLLDNDATLNGSNFTSDTLDTNVRWDVGADLKPTAFFNGGSGAFRNGTSIFLHIGGEDGTQGARGTFRDGSTKAVRFLMPKEYWRKNYPIATKEEGNQHPITLRFLNQKATEVPPPGTSLNTNQYPGPMYPWGSLDFEKPFIALGGLLESSLKITGVPVSDFTNEAEGSTPEIVDERGKFEIDLGLNFDLDGGFYTKDSNDEFESDPSSVTTPLLRGTRTLYDMLTNYGKDSTGNSSEVYVVIYGDVDSTNNNGAFKVIGAGTAGYTIYNASNATSIVVSPLSESFSEFDTETGNSVTVEFRSHYHNSDDISDYDANVGDLVVVLTDVSGNSVHPWNADTLDTNSIPEEVESKAVLSVTLLYHPGRGAFARVPNEITKVALQSPGSSYLAQNPSDIDSDFSSLSGAPENEVPFKAQQVQLWNRLKSYGWTVPDSPSDGGELVNFTEIDRESQVFYDKGSKTLIFRPFRHREMTLKQLNFSSDLGSSSLLGSYAYPSSDPKDPLVLWTGATGSGKKSCFALPSEFLPKFGRQDIPYYTDLDNGAGTFLPGINHLFTDSADATLPVFNIIGGTSNITAGNEAKFLHFVTGTPTNYGVSDTVIGSVNVPNIEARKTTEINPLNTYADEVISALSIVQSSEFGKGLKGIQLPPFYGVARVAGVYERADFIAKSGRTFKANRYEVETDPAKNLLRSDTKTQSLYILQNGAKDLTQVEDCHTYIIPENVLDLTRIPAYTSGDMFEDFDYVVVCTVFGFAKGFINKNNYVLVRRYNGQGTSLTDSSDLELEGVGMCIPCPAANNEKLLLGYERFVYQGDPYGTKDGSNSNYTDYENRYGEIPIESQYQLSEAIEQYDSNDEFVPQVVNPRGFQILAGMDFWTTLGTGKIGGPLFPGTSLDVGYTTRDAHDRIPSSDSANTWRIEPRAFTEGQGSNDSRAFVDLEILSPESFAHANDWCRYYGLKFKLLDNSLVKFGFTTQANSADIEAAGATPIIVGDKLNTLSYVINAEGLNFGNLSTTEGNNIGTVVLDSGDFSLLNRVELIDNWSVEVIPNTTVSTDWAYVNFKGYVSDDAEITLKAYYTISQSLLSGATTIPDVLVAMTSALTALVTSSFDPGDSEDIVISVPGAKVGSQVFAQLSQAYWAQPKARFTYMAYVSSANNVTVRVTNNTDTTLSGSLGFTLDVVVFNEATTSSLQINATDVDLSINLTRSYESKTLLADTIVEAINESNDLQRSVRAYRQNDYTVRFESYEVGAAGNNLTLETYITSWDNDTGTKSLPTLTSVFRLKSPYPGNSAVLAKRTKANFQGGVDLFVNAGSGLSQIALTGLTERLPLGILLQDHDFMGESPLRDNTSSLQIAPSTIFPVSVILPLTENGEEYTRFSGAPGEMIALSDGAILAYTAQTSEHGGTTKFRTYRGCSAYVLQGPKEGGPIAWSSGTILAASDPVLKGGVLVCKALLVRNYYEDAFASARATSYGDEIQLVILTYGILGDGTEQEDGIQLSGIISPSGYGEGYASADRYRISGHPLIRSWSKFIKDPSSVNLAPYSK